MSRRKYASRLRRVSRDQNVRTFTDEQVLKATWRAFKQTPNDDQRNRLVEHYLYLVRYAAERIRAKLPDEVDVDDLMSAGIFGLVDAIDAFDLERGVKFETYCAPRIRGAILDELRSMDWVPRLVRHRAHKLNETIRALEAEIGRIPTEDEIARHLKLPPDQFAKLLRDANAVSLVSLSQKFGDSESDRDVSEIDIVPDEQSCDPVAEAQKADIKEIITKELSRAERLIIVLYYYEQMTMKEIGATLDLSESRVSQMHSAIIARLRDQLGITTVEECLPTGTNLLA
jgi:RNA polymerase sigma factor for flagellar operon FliA